MSKFSQRTVNRALREAYLTKVLHTRIGVQLDRRQCVNDFTDRCLAYTHRSSLDLGADPRQSVGSQPAGRHSISHKPVVLFTVTYPAVGRHQQQL